MTHLVRTLASLCCGDVIYAPLGIASGVWIAILLVLLVGITAAVVMAVRAKKHNRQAEEYYNRPKEDKDE